MHELLSWSCINDCLDVFFSTFFSCVQSGWSKRMLPHDTILCTCRKIKCFWAFFEHSNFQLETKMALRVYIEQWLDDFGHLYERTWYFTRWRRVWKAEENQRYMQAMVVWRKLQASKARFKKEFFTLKYSVYSKVYKPWNSKHKVSRHNIIFHKWFACGFPAFIKSFAHLKWPNLKLHHFQLSFGIVIWIRESDV